MITGQYVQIPERLGIWGVKIRGSVRVGDVVEILRPNGAIHRHTIAEISRDKNDIRYCTIVPVTRERLKEVYGG
jgi:hypothetical protein